MRQRSHTPRDAWGHRKLEKAGRSLPQSHRGVGGSTAPRPLDFVWTSDPELGDTFLLFQAIRFVGLGHSSPGVRELPQPGQLTQERAEVAGAELAAWEPSVPRRQSRLCFCPAPAPCAALSRAGGRG